MAVFGDAHLALRAKDEVRARVVRFLKARQAEFLHPVRLDLQVYSVTGRVAAGPAEAFRAPGSELLRAGAVSTMPGRSAFVLAGNTKNFVADYDVEVAEKSQIAAPIVGQSFVAGAQLTTLNPALAEYFPVDRGVLVLEVLSDTPAESGGLTAGDVIVRIGGEEVSSMEDLRFGIGYLDRPLRLRVIRRGESIDIIIRE